MLQTPNNIDLFGLWATAAKAPKGCGMTQDIDVSNVTQSELDEILSAYNKGDQTEAQECRLVLYAYRELHTKNGFEPTTELIAERVTELINGYTIRQLTNKGLLDTYIDTDGNDSYGLTKLGKGVREKLEGTTSV